MLPCGGTWLAGRDDSSASGTSFRRKEATGSVRTRSTALLESSTSACTSGNAALRMLRREASPRAVCGQTACTVRRAGTGNGAMVKSEAPAEAERRRTTATLDTYRHRARARLYPFPSRSRVENRPSMRRYQGVMAAFPSNAWHHIIHIRLPTKWGFRTVTYTTSLIHKICVNSEMKAPNKTYPVKISNRTYILADQLSSIGTIVL